MKALTVKLISAIVSEKIKPLRPHVTNPYFSSLRRIDSQFTVALSLVQLSGNVITHACATSSFLFEVLNSLVLALLTLNIPFLLSRHCRLGVAPKQNIRSAD